MDELQYIFGVILACIFVAIAVRACSGTPEATTPEADDPPSYTP